MPWFWWHQRWLVCIIGKGVWRNGPTDRKGFPHISRILRMGLRPSIYPTVLGRGLDSYGYVYYTYIPLGRSRILVTYPYAQYVKPYKSLQIFVVTVMRVPSIDRNSKWVDNRLRSMYFSCQRLSKIGRVLQRILCGNMKGLSRMQKWEKWEVSHTSSSWKGRLFFWPSKSNWIRFNFIAACPMG